MPNYNQGKGFNRKTRRGGPRGVRRGPGTVGNFQQTDPTGTDYIEVTVVATYCNQYQNECTCLCNDGHQGYNGQACCPVWTNTAAECQPYFGSGNTMCEVSCPDYCAARSGPSGGF